MAEVTFFKFQSNINDFLSKLKSKPIQAQPSKFLKDNDLDKEKLIRVLIKRNIIKRKESIKDPTNSDEKVARYYVKYTIIREGYLDKLREMYNDYFKKEKLNECDGYTSIDASAIGGATSCDSSNGQYTTVIGGILSRPSYLDTRRRKNNKEPKPENILGKEIKAESMKKRIKLTESQMNYILAKKGLLNEEGEGGSIGGATTTFSVGADTTRGDMGYDVPAFGGSSKKGPKKDFFSDAMSRKPGECCIPKKRVGDK